VGRGGESGPAERRARASAIALAQLWPKAEYGAGARGVMPFPRGPHVRESERGGGGRRQRSTGGVNRPSAGENLATGGLDGDSPPATLFWGNE
jgi:hypothetical protein